MDIDLLIDVLVDTLKDTLTLIPFLFVTYVVMEAIEHSAEGKPEQIIRQAGKMGPLVGALLGALPQCGFSAMAGTLYAGRIITAGTLVAVILSTSDELIPVFLAQGAPVAQIAWIVGVKVVIGVVVGFAADAVLRALHRAGDGHPHIKELCERAHCHCGSVDNNHHSTYANVDSNDREERVRNHIHTRGSRWKHILRSAATHTIQVTGFIAIITFVFGILIEGAGHDAIASLLNGNPFLATLLAALIGLIPNCAASVAIAELYLEGLLATGPMLAGLLVSGGMGLLILFRTNYDMRQNVIIAVFIYTVSVVCGLIATLVIG